MSFIIKRKEGKEDLTIENKYHWHKSIVIPTEVDEMEIINDKSKVVHKMDYAGVDKSKIVGSFFHMIGIQTIGGRGNYNFKHVGEETGVVLSNGDIHSMKVLFKKDEKFLNKTHADKFSLNMDLHPIDKDKIKK